jgi:hypothetical protein
MAKTREIVVPVTQGANRRRRPGEPLVAGDVDIDNWDIEDWDFGDWETDRVCFAT